MAPALTKILKHDHGSYLSSPSASVRMDSDASTIMFTVELEPHMSSTDNWDLQDICLDLCSLSYLDAIDLPAHPVPLARGPTSCSQNETIARPAPASIANLPCFSKCNKESHQVATAFPGASGMFVNPLPEHNSQEAFLLYGHSVQPECWPDGSDVRPSSLIYPSVCPSFSHGEKTFPNPNSMCATNPTMMYEELERLLDLPSTAGLRQLGTGFINPDQLETRNLLEDAAKGQLYKQVELQGRACRLQKKLQALLGEHALKHCSQQLEGLKKHFQLEDVPLENLESVTPPQTHYLPCEESVTSSAFFPEMMDFCESNRIVLKGLQEALDSEATASSSSDDESENDMLLPLSSSSKMQWLEERAELSSRWTWLQLRLSELDERKKQLVEIHKQIRSTKGSVVLAQSQPLTDRQIQQTLMREMASLSCTVSDTEAEPCSPTRLLYNIEKQSAQLSQIVNSLMPPLSASPLSKQPSKGRNSFTSVHGKDDVFLTGTSNRRTFKSRRLLRVDASCVCARTRPLISYHKRKLLSFTPCNTARSPKARKSLSTLLSTCTCESVCLCSELDCSSRSRFHHVEALSPGKSLGMSSSHHVQKIMAREEWIQKPLVFNSKLLNPPNYGRISSSPRHSRKHKQHVRRNTMGVLGLSPIRSPETAWRQNRRTNQRKRKRRRLFSKDDQDVLYQLCDLGDSSNEMLEENFGQFTLSWASQGKQDRGRVYNINDVVIPMTLSKVEKLQYKDILTPSWRVIDIQALKGTQMGEDQKIEDLSDDVFARRHLALEQKEKRRCPSWGNRGWCRGSTRSASRLSGIRGGVCTSGEESSVERRCSQLDSDEQPRSEEGLQPQAPWESRVFPLDEHEEAVLLSDEVKIPSGWTESSCLSSKPSSSLHSPTQSACTTPPSSGQN
ncbi:PREDICTED: KAT8 regulatory NSL complex subunit 1-like protein isoform X2 [Cyprinodon variegatus]|uniref:KAT8 regulatory NSL complex subunit 1-like protein isoform X2 n=1 Tax=Cyprinodon variegatus TaxID=28743 RepID=UPI0007427227|nr:PREDICTED: KAT8 regulatory NSL complex subunit 1-like protein isoform X2 [Cyprinodon variegatus]